PREPTVPITNRAAMTSWLIYGAVLFVAAFIPLVAGPDTPSTHHGTTSLTMTFVVVGFGDLFNSLTNRRDPTTGLSPPILTAVGIALASVTFLFLATQLPGLQKGLLTVPLNARQWLASIGLALLLPLVIETSKWLRRRHAPKPAPLDPRLALTPSRALSPDSADPGPAW
ncbi:MAG: cation transporting ATPase C-terminal domain-containing protein, partial [Acidimicrobiaceae bacterium]|nr:cation transporting ATPase C-terminal domain-containing protein [Acidimicrobiaceae bacterium]